MTLFTDSNVILPEPDPREHCLLPAAQVAHGSTVEMSRSSAEPEAFHRDITFVDTQGFRDELIMEVDMNAFSRCEITNGCIFSGVWGGTRLAGGGQLTLREPSIV